MDRGLTWCVVAYIESGAVVECAVYHVVCVPSFFFHQKLINMELFALSMPEADTKRRDTTRYFPFILLFLFPVLLRALYRDNIRKGLLSVLLQ